MRSRDVRSTFKVVGAIGAIGASGCRLLEAPMRVRKQAYSHPAWCLSPMLLLLLKVWRLSVDCSATEEASAAKARNGTVLL